MQAEAVEDLGWGPWLLAGLLPAVAGAPPAAVLAWAAALLAGALVAATPTRWVAVGWLAAVLVPGTPALVVAAAGLLIGRGRDRLLAATGGALLGLATLPPLGLRAGALLIAAGALATLARSNRRFDPQPLGEHGCQRGYGANRRPPRVER